MAVVRLALTDFRSYPGALIEPAPGLVILTGENGAGKTNLLEAVSLLAPGRGLRQAMLGQVSRVGGAGGFAVAARLADGVEIGTGTVPAAPERRQVRINGVAAPATGLAERLAVLWLTPAMDRLFAESAGGRRRFLDRLVLALEPGHAIHATRYEAAMRARTRLLTDDRVPDRAWLDALEGAMAEHGEAVGEARARVIDALASRLDDAAPGPFARASIALEVDAADEPLRERLRSGRTRDAQAGRALVGPHRADLLVRHRDRDVPAALCSTGEQKALLLGLVLAHADLVANRVGRRPVLLLDEVAAHLDPLRRAALLERLGAAGGQVWMTGTEPALFVDAPPPAQRLTVHDGVVTAE